MTPSSDHLSTDPSRDLASVLRAGSLAPGAVLVLQVMSRERSDDARMHRGKWIHAFWTTMLERVPGVHGHRLLWDQLLFILPNTVVDSAAKVVSQIAQGLSHEGDTISGSMSAATQVSAQPTR